MSDGKGDVMRQRMMNFMRGRYGLDQLNIFIAGFIVFLMLLNLFLRNPVVSVLGFALIVYLYFRMFSRNITKRSDENTLYLKKTWKIRMRLRKEKGYMQLRKTHHIYHCPSCRQKIKIPRGRGKISITCPKCSKQFIRKS